MPAHICAEVSLNVSRCEMRAVVLDPARQPAGPASHACPSSRANPSSEPALHPSQAFPALTMRWRPHQPERPPTCTHSPCTFRTSPVPMRSHHATSCLLSVHHQTTAHTRHYTSKQHCSLPPKSRPSSSNKLLEELLVKLCPQLQTSQASRVSIGPGVASRRGWRVTYEVVDELLLWRLVDAPGLVLEDDIVVPPALDAERGGGEGGGGGSGRGRVAEGGLEVQ